MNIPYGQSHFPTIRKEQLVYVDKTRYIPMLEDPAKGRFFLLYLRPRRFGKTTLLSMLENYYDRNQTEHFEALFSGLHVGAHPTPRRNQYLILRLEFTGINTDGTLEQLQRTVYDKLRDAVSGFCQVYQAHLPALEHLREDLDFTDYPAALINRLLSVVHPSGQQIYLLVDEYDNFTNALIARGRQELYLKLTHDGGFMRELYKTFKAGTSTGAIGRVLITGVSPMTLDDITSGANIFKDITHHEDFAALTGFTQTEVESLADLFLQDPAYQLDRAALLEDLRRYYNGYRLTRKAGEPVYNPDMVLYFFSEMQPPDQYPAQILDNNVRIDYGRLRSLLFQPDGTPREASIAAVRTVIETAGINAQVRESFPLELAYVEETFVSLLYYLGMLTRPAPGSESLRLVIPNQVTRQLYGESLAYLLADLAQVELQRAPLEPAIKAMGFDGDVEPFLRFLHEHVLRYLSRRDLIKLDERSVKFIPLAHLCLLDLFLPFSEMEHIGGYSDLILPLNRRKYPDARYSYLLEFKYLKVEDPVSRRGTAKKAGAAGKKPEPRPDHASRRASRVEAALVEAEAQIQRYLADPRLHAFGGEWKAAAVVCVGTEAIYFRQPGTPTKKVG